MTIEEVVAVAVPVARALAHAHAEGIVHRDVKPENIFLVQRSQGRWGVKVVDFGIAKTPVTPKLTRIGETLGSPLFMAPEMIRGDEDVDQRADVYSFGVLLYLMLCGRLPFCDDDLMKVMHMHLSSPPPAPRAVNPGLSVEIAEIVDRSLAKHPDDRYPSMEALLVDLEAALPTGSDRMLIEAQSGASLQETPFAGALAMSRTGQRPVARPQSQRNSAVLPTAPPRSRAPVIVALAAVAVALIGAAGWYQLGVRSARNEAAALASRPATRANTAAANTAAAANAAANVAPVQTEPAVAPVAAVETAPAIAAVASPETAPAGNAPAETSAAGAAAAAKLVETEPATPNNATGAARPLRVATLAPLQPVRPSPGRGAPGKKQAPPRAAVRRGQKPAVAGPQIASANDAPGPALDRSAAPAPPAGAPDAAPTAGDAAPGTAPGVPQVAALPGGSGAPTPSTGSAAPVAAPAAPAVASAPAPTAPAPAPGSQSAPAAATPAIARPAAAPAAPAAPRALDAIPELASFDLQGSLPSSVARRSVERVLPALRACYSAAARAGRTAPAFELRLSFEIDENSLATHVGVGEVRFGTFSRCAAGVASEIHTPQAPDVGTARVTAVIKFRPL